MDARLVCCSSCFGEVHISRFIRTNGTFGQCSFCEDSRGRKIRAKVLDVSTLYEFLMDCVSLHYDEPHPDFIPRDSDTGDFVEDGESFGYVLYELGAECKHDDLIEELERYSPISLAHRNSWVPTLGEYNHDRWEEFKDRIDEIVDALGAATVDESVESIVDGLSSIIPIRKIPTSRTLIRLRPILSGDCFPPTPEELGSHPSPTHPNRFTPRGTSAFYGSFDILTALGETLRTDTMNYAVGEWVANMPLYVADFSRLPKYGGPFDVRTNRLHEHVGFIQAFIDEISLPIDPRDDATQYRPTQIFYEGIIQRLTRNGVHGFIYRSSKRRGGECVVLNIDSSLCVSKFDPAVPFAQLRLRKHSVHTIIPG